MASFNGGNNPLYPQIYNQVNAPPQPGQPLPHYPTPVLGYPTQGAPPYPHQPGFAVYPNQPPSALSYPTGYQMMPPAFGGIPTAPTQQQPFVTEISAKVIDWIPTTPRDATALSNKAVVAGYEGHDHSPLWVIRSRFQGDTIPGKLAIKHCAAYVPWGGKENCVQTIEVCCAVPEKIRWVETRDGNIPPNAVIGGSTADGEPLYIGRAREQGSLTPGKVHPSHKSMYISFAGQEIAHKVYDILCTV